MELSENTTENSWFRKLCDKLPHIPKGQLAPGFVESSDGYLKTLAIHGIVVPGSEKFLDLEHCIYKSILDNDLEAFKYFYPMIPTNIYQRGCVLTRVSFHYYEWIMEWIFILKRKEMYTFIFQNIPKTFIRRATCRAVALGWDIYVGYMESYEAIVLKEFIEYIKTTTQIGETVPIVIHFQELMIEYPVIIYFAFLANPENFLDWIERLPKSKYHDIVPYAILASLALNKSKLSKTDMNVISKYTIPTKSLCHELVRRDDPELLQLFGTQVYREIVTRLNSNHRIFPIVTEYILNTRDHFNAENFEFSATDLYQILLKHIGDIQSWKTIFDGFISRYSDKNRLYTDLRCLEGALSHSKKLKSEIVREKLENI